MTETTTNTNPTTENPQAAAPEAPKAEAKMDARLTDTARGLVDELVKLGTTWAAYGLTAGENALHQSATSLESVAKMLGKVAENLRPHQQPPQAPQA